MHVLFSILIYWTALSIVNCCPYTIVNCGSFNNGHFLYFLFLPLRSKNMLQDTIKYPMVISISICTSKNEKPYSPYLGLKKNLWFRFPTDPIFSADLLFFQRDWCDPIFSGWLRAAHTACPIPNPNL